MALPSQILDAEEAELEITRSILALGSKKDNAEENTAVQLQELGNIWEGLIPEQNVEKIEYPDLESLHQSIEKVCTQNLEKFETLKERLDIPDISPNDGNLKKKSSVHGEELELTNEPRKLSNSEFQGKPVSLLALPEDEYHAEKLKQQNQSLNSLVMRESEVGSMVSTKITLDKPQSQNEVVKEEPDFVSPNQESQRVRNEPSTNRQNICRICLENEENAETGAFIKPCRCIGSMESVHDECLKTWIVSKGRGIKCASCELCGTNFVMKFKTRTKFHPMMALKERTLGFLSCCCLSFTVMVLVAIISAVAVKWSNSNNASVPNTQNSNSTACSLSIIVFCGIICSLVFMFMMMLTRDICFRVEIKEWVILPPNLNDPPLDLGYSSESRSDSWQDYSYNPEPEVQNIQQRHVNDPSHGGEERSQQINESSVHSEVGEFDQNQQAMSRNASTLDKINASVDISQSKDLNMSGASEGVPLRIVSRLKDRMLPGIKQNLIHNDKFIRTQTLSKNSGTSSVCSNLQQTVFLTSNSLVFELGSNVPGQIQSKKLVSNNSERNIIHQARNLIQAEPLGTVKSASYTNFSKKTLSPKTQNTRPATAQHQRNGPVLLCKQIPKAFLVSDNENNKKIIEVVINTTSPKDFEDEGKSEYAKPNMSSPVSNQTKIKKALTQTAIGTGKPNPLPKSQGSSITIIAHQT